MPLVYFVLVLSPSTERIDRGEKLLTYQRYPTIQEILRANSRRRFVEHYHRVGTYKWEMSQHIDDAKIIELTSIEVSLTVRDIYFKVYLDLEEEGR